MGPLIPLFWTSGDICPGFQSQGESLFACFLSYVILRFTSGVRPTDCIEVSMAAKPFFTTYLQTCPQGLVEFQVGAQTHDCLCSEHSTVYHSGTKAQEEPLSFFQGCVTTYAFMIQDTSFQQKCLKLKVSWLLCIDRLVSKTDNVMHLVHKCRHVIMKRFIYIWCQDGVKMEYKWDWYTSFI